MWFSHCLMQLYVLCPCSGLNPAVVHQTQLLHTLLFLSWDWKTGACSLTCFVFNIIRNKIPHDLFYISSGLVWGFLNYNGIHCIEAQKKRDSRNLHIMLNVTNKGIPKSVYTTWNTSHVTHSARILSPRGWMNRYCKFRLVSFS